MAITPECVLDNLKYISGAIKVLVPLRVTEHLCKAVSKEVSHLQTVSSTVHQAGCSKSLHLRAVSSRNVLRKCNANGVFWKSKHFCKDDVFQGVCVPGCNSLEGNIYAD